MDPGYDREPTVEDDDRLRDRQPLPFHHESPAGGFVPTARAQTTALRTGLPGRLAVEEADQAAGPTELYVATEADLVDLQAELAARTPPAVTPAVGLPSGGELAYTERPSCRERRLHRESRAVRDERHARAVLYPRSGRIEVSAA